MLYCERVLEKLLSLVFLRNFRLALEASTFHTTSTRAFSCNARHTFPSTLASLLFVSLQTTNHTQLTRNLQTDLSAMPSSRVSSSGAIRKPTKKPAKAPTPEPTLKPAHSSYPMWEYRWHKKPLGARLMWCGPLEANEYKPDARQQIKYRIRLHAGCEYDD